MFSFFKKKPPPVETAEVAPVAAPIEPAAPVEPPAIEPERRSWLDRLRGLAGDLVAGGDSPPPDEPLPSAEASPSLPLAEPPPVDEPWRPAPRVESPPASASTSARSASAAPAPLPAPAAPPPPLTAPLPPPPPEPPRRRFSWAEPSPEPVADESLPNPEALPDEPPPERRNWFDKLRGGLRKTGSSLAQVFTGTRIDEALYEELEAALLMADAGVRATEFLLDDLKWRVKEAKVTDPAAVKSLLAEAVAELLRPLEKPLVVGEQVPTVMMVVGVNGAGKTTTIGKLTRHLAAADQKVLLAAADTFRAAAREQLAVWAGRNRVEIVSQEGGDPAAVTFDAVIAGKARGCDVVIADTAGRLTTQVHLMDELKKIRRVIGKAQAGAPHEVLLVVDGNTGQNALSQVQLFDAALGLTGLVITKLDGTAKGGVLAAIALWSRDRQQADGDVVPLPVYFIGVGEKLEDLQTFDAREFAQALLG